jgi:tetratricopeptide (TPR) repeat protein
MFRRTLTLKPDLHEARLRLGRVLGRTGRHEEAVRELRAAAASLDDPLLNYYVQLFLGAEEEALGRFDAARAAYETAAAIYPTSQAPRIGLIELARRRGDRLSALRVLQEMFDLPSFEPGRDDPWWAYDTAQARDTNDLLAELWRPFLSEPGR